MSSEIVKWRVFERVYEGKESMEDVFLCFIRVNLIIDVLGFEFLHLVFIWFKRDCITSERFQLSVIGLINRLF
jgi:hypothetical protein